MKKENRLGRTVTASCISMGRLVDRAGSGPGDHLRAMAILLVGVSFMAGTGAVGADDGKWSALQIVDVNAMDWDEQPRFKSKSKTFFRGDKGSFVYARFSPTWDTKPFAGGPLGSHYHLWNEFAYMLEGDLVVTEPVSPYQKNGALYRYVEGTWLDRPAYTLHGGGWVTGGLRAQNPCTLIIFEEGDGSVVTVGPDGDHYQPDFEDTPEPYEPDWQAVKQFPRPWIVDSAAALEWEDDTVLAGRLVKWLSDDQLEGFRAQLVKIPPGWTSPEGTPRTYFEQANRMRYMIYGDMQVWNFDGPDSAGEATTVTKDFYIHQGPRSIWGYGDGPVTEQGAVWLEVTYAKGLTHGGGEIEQPIALE